MKLDNFAQQIQDMQQRLAQIQKRVSELPSMQQQNEIMATALEELGKGLEEMIIPSQLDLQERKQTQELAKRSAAEISQIFNRLPCLIWKFCPSIRQFIYASDSLTELSGISREAFFQNPQLWNDRVDSGTESQLSLRIAWEAITKGEPYRVVYLFHTLHGESCWFEVTARPAKEDGVLYYYGCTTDITERKQSEESLKASEERFRCLCACSPIGISLADVDGHCTYANPRLLALTGMTLEEVLRENWAQAVHPDDRDQVFAEWSRYAQAGQEFSQEYRLQTPEGIVRWVRVRTSAMRSTQGELIGHVATVEDISERKQAESALKESYEFLQTVLDTNPNLIWVKDTEDRIILANQALADFFGTTVEDLLGLTNYDLHTNPANAQLCIAQDQEVINTLQQKFIPEEAFPSATGEVRWFQTIKTPLFSKDGQVGQVLGVSTDITQRNLAEQVQRQTQARLRRLVEANLIGVIFADFSGNITEANDTFLEMVGYTREELRSGKVRWIDMTPPEYAEDDAQAREQIRLTGVCTPHEKEYIRKDGTRVPILTGSALLEDSDQDCVSFVLDLTWRKQAERQIEESLQEKEVLLQEIHHRVKNNLQVVSSLLDLQSLQIKEPTMLEMFRESQNRVKSMALVHENLYQSKNFAKVNFTDYIETLIRNLFQVYAVNTDHITLEQYLDDVTLTIDTAMPCGLIINELVSNALKHAFPSKNSGKISITLHSNEDENYTLTITDNGIGLPLNWDVKTVDSLGFQLVKILVNQIGGILQVDCRACTKFSIMFSEKSLKFQKI